MQLSQQSPNSHTKKTRVEKSHVRTQVKRPDWAYRFAVVNSCLSVSRAKSRLGSSRSGSRSPRSCATESSTLMATKHHHQSSSPSLTTEDASPSDDHCATNSSPTSEAPRGDHEVEGQLTTSPCTTDENPTTVDDTPKGRGDVEDAAEIQTSARNNNPPEKSQTFPGKSRPTTIDVARSANGIGTCRAVDTSPNTGGKSAMTDVPESTTSSSTHTSSSGQQPSKVFNPFPTQFVNSSQRRRAQNAIRLSLYAASPAPQSTSPTGDRRSPVGGWQAP